jgi:hypothetical protein
MGEQNPKAARVPKIGGFALLRTFLHAKGTGAPSPTPAVNLNRTTNTCSKLTSLRVTTNQSRVAITLVTLVGLLFSAPTAANAAFSRKFERHIFRSEGSGGHLVTEPCTEAEATAPGSPCLNPGGRVGW